MCSKSLRLAAFIVGLGLSSLISTGCVTTGRSKAASEKVVKKKNGLPRNYSLMKTRDLNPKWLTRGQKQMAGAALDSY